MRVFFALLCVVLCSACAQETIRFRAGPDQQAITRDGQPAVISQKQSTLVMIRPAFRKFAGGERPVFVVAVHNLSKAPIEFHARDIAVMQVVGGHVAPMKVFSYEELVEEEEGRQVMTALLVGAAAGANTLLASQAGTRTKTTTVHGPGGSYSYRTTSYSPSAAVAAQNRAYRQNQRMVDAAIKDGNASLIALEQEVIKDNTLMPGEWYGGTLHVQAPADGASGPKTYSIAMTVGPDRHEIDVVQESVK
jgi:hypothetical protein